MTVNSTGNNIGTNFAGLDLYQMAATDRETIGALFGGGTVSLARGTLAVGAGNFTGLIGNGAHGFATGGNLLRYGPGTLSLSGANTYTGTTTVNGGTLVLDTTTTGSVLNSGSKLAMGGGKLQLNDSAGNDRTQTVAGLTVNAGASTIEVTTAAGNVTTLNLNTMNRAAGGTVDFNATGGALGGEAKILTTKVNNVGTGILGGWATVNGGAAFAQNSGANGIVAYTGYTDIGARGSMIGNGANTNVRINSAGTVGDITLAATTTNINTLTQDFLLADATVDNTAGVLRFGTEGGIFITPTGGNLIIGTGFGVGVVTAGGADGVAGELILGNFSSTSMLTINSVIGDNVGGGVVSLTKTGAGTRDPEGNQRLHRRDEGQ